jgi:hypothetical protein
MTWLNHCRCGRGRAGVGPGRDKRQAQDGTGPGTPDRHADPQPDRVARSEPADFAHRPPGRRAVGEPRSRAAPGADRGGDGDPMHRMICGLDPGVEDDAAMLADLERQDREAQRRMRWPAWRWGRAGRTCRWRGRCGVGGPRSAWPVTELRGRGTELAAGVDVGSAHCTRGRDSCGRQYPDPDGPAAQSAHSTASQPRLEAPTAASRRLVRSSSWISSVPRCLAIGDEMATFLAVVATVSPMQSCSRTSR